MKIDWTVAGVIISLLFLLGGIFHGYGEIAEAKAQAKAAYDKIEDNIRTEEQIKAMHEDLQEIKEALQTKATRQDIDDIKNQLDVIQRRLQEGG